MTNAYRHAIDAALRGEKLEHIWVEETDKVSHRPYTTGFYFSEPGEHYSKTSYYSSCDVAAVVVSCDEEGNAVLTQRNKFSRGDRLELLCPGMRPIAFTAGEIFDTEGAGIQDARHAMMELNMRLPVKAEKLSIVRKLK